MSEAVRSGTPLFINDSCASVVQLTGVPCVRTDYERGRFATAGCER